jgi:CheY-like chemotaxis protein
VCSILIVDDHPEVREVIGEALRRGGHDVGEASNGADALQWLATHADHPPCLIILDLMMPVMDGWDFLERFRQEPAWTNLPVIVLSALVKDGKHQPVMKAEAFWSKPVDDARFDGIRELCPQHRTPPAGTTDGLGGGG